MLTIISEWIYCPVCGNKTRTMIREDTELKNFPLYCPKCKQETIINVQDMKITLAVSKFMYAAAIDNTITAVFQCLSAISVKGFFMLFLRWFLLVAFLYLT
ncbi:cysteine-rich KTR domain-containing protein [Peptostreptococcus porci]